MIFLMAGLSAFTVYPLWLLAGSHPRLYSYAVATVALLLFIILIFKQIKKQGLKESFFFLIKLSEFSAGLFFTLMLLFKGMRLAALFTVFFAGIIFLLTIKFLKKNQKELSTEK